MRIVLLLLLFPSTAFSVSAQTKDKILDSIYHSNLEQCAQLIEKQNYASAKRALSHLFKPSDLEKLGKIETQYLKQKKEWLDSALVYKQYYVDANRKFGKIKVSTNDIINKNVNVRGALRSLYGAAQNQPHSLRKGIMHRQILYLPLDTIQIDYGRPLQVYMEGKGYFWKLLVDTNALRVVKDSTLYNGKYIIRANNKVGYNLHVYKYIDGKIVKRYKEGYVKDRSSGKTAPKLRRLTNYHQDTTVTFSYYEDTNKLIVSYLSQIDSASYYSYKRYDSLPLLAASGSSSTITELGTELERFASVDYIFDTNGDTLEQYFLSQFSRIDETSIRINRHGDTTELKVIENIRREGLNYELLHMTNPITSEWIYSKSKFKWKSGLLIDILDTNTLFFDEKSKLISELQFIELVNSSLTNGAWPTKDWQAILCYMSELDLTDSEEPHKNMKLEDDSFFTVYQYGKQVEGDLLAKRSVKMHKVYHGNKIIPKKTSVYIFN